MGIWIKNSLFLLFQQHTRPSGQINFCVFYVKKLNKYPNVSYKKSIEEALNSLNSERDDLIIITGSLYLAGELLNLN